MPKYFPSVTHALVHTVPSAKEMEAMKGTLAFVSICFGPGDDASLNMIAIKKIAGPTVGVQAHVPKAPMFKDGKVTYLPTIVGKPADELRLLALQAFDRVKSSQGLKFNKNYRVAKEVEEIVSTAQVAG